MKQRILTFLLALLSVSVWGNAWGQGEDVDKLWYNEDYDSFTISKPEELAGLADLVNNENVNFEGKTIILGDDIDLSGREWTPIGLDNRYFSGTFDAKHHKIKINKFNSNYKYVGLFGCVLYGTIKNLNVEGKINLSNWSNFIESAAGICASLDKGIIRNCNFEGEINVEGVTIDFIGGVCGNAVSANITDCSNKADINVINFKTSAYNTYKSFIGGVVGTLRNNSKFSRCFNEGNIDIDINKDVDYTLRSFGGVAGYFNGLECGYCYNVGKINVKGNDTNSINSIGGVLGKGSGINCYNIGKIVVSKISEIEYDEFGIISSGTFVGGVTGDLSWESLFNSYNYGNIEVEEGVRVGNIYSYTNPDIDDNYKMELSECYYLNQEIPDAIDGVNKPEGIDVTSKLKNDFSNGEVAWLLRQLNEDDGSYVFGQNLNESSSDKYPKLQSLDDVPAVYQLMYKYNNDEVTQYYNQGQTTEALPKLENDLRWFDKEEGIEYKSRFEMPAKDLELVAETGYNVTIKNSEGGEIKVSPIQDKYRKDAEVSFTITTNDGYDLISYECNTEANTKVDVTKKDDGTYSFTMPAANVTISATFEKIKYTVTTKVAEGCEVMGTVSESGEYAAGEDVTVTATPNEGYEFDSWEVDGPDSYTPDGNIIKFIMPAKDVTITAKFKETETPGVPVSYNDLYIIKSEGAKLLSRYDKKRTPDGGSFTLSLEKEEGYEDCEPTVYYKRGRFGEWKELKLDEVSGYYQIRSVYTDIYVKVSGDGIWPVSNEEVEAQEVKVYTQNGAIIVSTPSLVDVQIISMTGSVVAADKVAGQREFRNLAEGVYIVRVGDKIVKVRL